MSDITPDPAELGQIRTLAVRITDGLRAQLDVIAQVNDRSTSEEIRLALVAYAKGALADPKFKERAESIRAAIEREANAKRAELEREAEAKRSTLDAIFGAAGLKTTKPGKPSAAADS